MNATTESNMTNKINTGADAKALFSFTLTKPCSSYRIGADGKREPLHPPAVTQMLGTEQTVKHYQSYPTHYTVADVKPSDERWPEGVTVETTGRRTPFRCYVEAIYAVTAPRELTDFEFQLLRAQGAFMGGQQEGAVMGEPVQKDGVWTYTCMSICDSGD